MSPFEWADGAIESVITKRSAEEMGFEIGDWVMAVAQGH